MAILTGVIIGISCFCPVNPTVSTNVFDVWKCMAYFGLTCMSGSSVGRLCCAGRHWSQCLPALAFACLLFEPWFFISFHCQHWKLTLHSKTLWAPLVSKIKSHPAAYRASGATLHWPSLFSSICIVPWASICKVVVTGPLHGRNQV